MLESLKGIMVFKMAVSSLEGHFTFIAFFYPYPIVNTNEIKFGELFGSTLLIYRIIN